MFNIFKFKIDSFNFLCKNHFSLNDLFYEGVPKINLYDYDKFKRYNQI